MPVQDSPQDRIYQGYCGPIVSFSDSHKMCTVRTIAVLNQVRGHLVSSTRSPVNSYQVSGKGSQVLVCQLPGG
jgi:hypothetical protein